jgi:hypothetical protein
LGPTAAVKSLLKPGPRVSVYLFVFDGYYRRVIVHVRMGRILLSVKSMSMEPWGQPEPPETTFVILYEGGLADTESGMGFATATATRAAAVKVYFIVR